MKLNNNQHLEIGKKGEDIVCKYLKDGGYRIKDRNYWKKWGEIDIVAEKQGIIHFVEVKTRTIVGPGQKGAYSAEESIHLWKRQRSARVIETYLSEKRIGEEVDWQIDAMIVYLDANGALLNLDVLEDIIL